MRVAVGVGSGGGVRARGGEGEEGGECWRGEKRAGELLSGGWRCVGV